MGLLSRAAAEKAEGYSSGDAFRVPEDPFSLPEEEREQILDIMYPEDEAADTGEEEPPGFAESGTAETPPEFDAFLEPETVSESFNEDVFSLQEEDQEQILDIMYPEDKGPEASAEDSGETHDRLSSILQEAEKKFGTFQGIVLEGAENDFSQRIAPMVSAFALVSETGGRCLVLFDSSIDGKLLSHRLLKAAQSKTILSFKADDSREALSILTPHL